jgi:hypothetical protein
MTSKISLWTKGLPGAGGQTGEVMENSCPHTLLYLPPPLNCSSVVSFIIDCNHSKVFSWILYAMLANDQTWGGSQKKEWLRTCNLHLSGPFNLWDLTLMPDIQCQKWIKLLDTQLVSRELENLLVWKNISPGKTSRVWSQAFSNMTNNRTSEYVSQLRLPFQNTIDWVA